MKFFHNSKKLLNRAQRYTWPVVGLATVFTFLLGASRQVYSPVHRKMAKSDSTSTLAAHSSKNSQKTPPKTAPSAANKPADTSTPPPATAPGVQAPAFGHLNITTTIFWVGEPATADNGFIANSQSAWDEQWKDHFGGFDDPNSRSGFYPAAFTPKENPFYFALPYSDIDDNGNRKASATNCPLYASMNNQPYSWCKNSWIAIRSSGKTVYAQWQDTGPYEEDDTAYVFGSAAPKNRRDAKAGLDVSPAVRDYLGLEDVDTCDWSFVPADNVPVGPWKQIVTTNRGESI